MKTKGADGKWYRRVDIGRGQTMLVEVKENKFIAFIKRLLK